MVKSRSNPPEVLPSLQSVGVVHPVDGVSVVLASPHGVHDQVQRLRHIRKERERRCGRAVVPTCNPLQRAGTYSAVRASE